MIPRFLAAILVAQLVLTTGPAVAQDPDPWWDRLAAPTDAGTPPTDAPLAPPALDLVLEADGRVAPGRSMKIKAGDVAPFNGRLLDEQEQVRRGKINARNEASLNDLKAGNVIIRTPVAIALVLGVAVASAAIAVLVTTKALESPRP
jgi:hypothetical protein